MKIDVNIKSKVKNNLVKKAMEFYVKELKLENSTWMMVIDTVKGMNDDEGNGFVGGVINPAPGLLVMALDSNLGLAEIAEVISHEMVHVKQYATGRLRFDTYRGKSVAVWNGKRQPTLAYLDMPWERQAMREQKLLSYKFDSWLFAQ